MPTKEVIHKSETTNTIKFTGDDVIHALKLTFPGLFEGVEKSAVRVFVEPAYRGGTDIDHESPLVATWTIYRNKL